MKPVDPLPVKLVLGVLYSDESLRDEAFSRLEACYGKTDYKSKIFNFDITDYYVPEMGTPIYRQFISFYRLIHPKELPAIKLECNEIEKEVSLKGNRKVNLDPGYMDYDKFVLASAKYNGHKVYLDHGIYADVTYQFSRGRYVPVDFAFPDFKTSRYSELFLHIRAKYKGQMRKRMRETARTESSGPVAGRR
ncbi:DUF4416 family protein [candidate division KSB1 bacterium]|nr:DUF4416 family protein [candidate division KSB1 bacterium]